MSYVDAVLLDLRLDLVSIEVNAYDSYHRVDRKSEVGTIG